ncbi:MAG TPA: alpha/beta hydrolase [Drouetiella sp.]
MSRLILKAVLRNSLLLAAATLSAQTIMLPPSASASDARNESEWHPATWKPAAGLKQAPIWSSKIPDTFPIKGPEELNKEGDCVGKVSTPTMTVYPARGKNTGAAVVIFPGGGYWILAMQLEGTDVCDWLTEKGVTCILLKYRVPGSGLFPRSGCYPQNKAALEDAQRTIRVIRSKASELHIDPHKIGVIGFSAGGHLVAATSTLYDKDLYKPMDAIDKVSCRPDFGIALYPGHLTEHTKGNFQLNPFVPVTKNTPPTFIVQAENDPVDEVENSLVYFAALKKAGVPTELHIYPDGKHAFGLKSKLPVSNWTSLAEKWMQSIGVLKNET